MTSYSTYGTGRIRLVDGSLGWEDDERREDELYMLTHAVASGAARALLDCTLDSAEGREDAEVNATDWHSADEGWELDAIRDEDREAFLDIAGRFVRDNLEDVLTLANRIGWGEQWRGEMWHGDQGMAIYRVGMLLGYSGAGTGIGFEEYSDHRHGENYSTGLPARLSQWLDSVNTIGWEQSWIDSTEEPCLLHLSV